MDDQLVIPVDRLVGHTGKERRFDSERPIRARLGESWISGPMQVQGKLVGTNDGVNSHYRASAEAHLVCTRCLTEWVEPLIVEGDQYFRLELDEDGYGIVDGSVDVGQPAHDEVALALPAAPRCKPDCLGLCPTCGTDLNREPCDGHGEDPDSPFAVLKDLFDS
ncbi:MAG: DUF177 domain-containing protein [Acidimicrobiia bacterium]|nr:DUF177 domain-containing protein [Acidimicrobiia bacterium]MDH3462351.1 DUF177 domain-containing protein [Acidimicrobiia bacterium]